ncbi:MAG TPA: ion transporter permease [Micromonosporaceae bacterium]|nr:ion transporter permease [Micromonosporaceae bacterium]
MNLNLLRRFTNSPRALVGSYLILIVVSGALYWQFETTDEKPLGIGDAVWWAVVTASTVGYGDTYPNTWQGRILAGLLISVMVLFVIPLITAHFASKLIVDNDAFQHEEQEEIKNQLREIRALVQSLRRDGGDGLVAQLDEVEARVDHDLRG